MRSSALALKTLRALLTLGASLVIATTSCTDKLVEEQDEVDCPAVTASGFLAMVGIDVIASEWDSAGYGTVDLNINQAPVFVEFKFLASDSAVLTLDPDCTNLEFRWVINDSDVVAISPSASQWSLSEFAPLAVGSTSARFEVWRNSTLEYISAWLSVEVDSGSPHISLGANAIVVARYCNDLASWNYDTENAPGQSAGYLIVEEGKVLDGLEVVFLDTTRSLFPIRDILTPLDPAYSIDWGVGNSSIATVEAESTSRWGIRVRGQAVGNTTISIRLLYNGVPELVTGGIRIIVRPNGAADADSANFRILLSSWRVIVRDGKLVLSDTPCGRTVPGQLEAVVGELSDHFSLRLLNDACTTTDPSVNTHRLIFDFADSCVARAVSHPADWGHHFIFHLVGVNPGQTTVRMHFVRVDNIVEWTSPPIPVVVSE